MKKPLYLSSGLLAAGLLFVLGTSSVGCAQDISTTNVFSLKPVNMNYVNYGSNAAITDGTVDYGDPGQDQNLSVPSLLNISGFNSDIDTIKIYSGWVLNLRISPSVTIYYSAFNLTSTNIGDYDGSTGLLVFPEDANGYYTNLTSPLVQDPQFGGSNIYYTVLAGLNIPTGTQSLLFAFDRNGGLNGYSPNINEIQGFASAIPEPSTWAMILGGLGMLVVLKRVRRAKA